MGSSSPSGVNTPIPGRTTSSGKCPIPMAWARLPAGQCPFSSSPRRHRTMGTIATLWPDPSSDRINSLWAIALPLLFPFESIIPRSNIWAASALKNSVLFFCCWSSIFFSLSGTDICFSFPCPASLLDFVDSPFGVGGMLLLYVDRSVEGQSAASAPVFVLVSMFVTSARAFS